MRPVKASNASYLLWRPLTDNSTVRSRRPALERRNVTPAPCSCVPPTPLTISAPSGGKRFLCVHDPSTLNPRSEEHTSELQSLMRISYAVFCLKKKNKIKRIETKHKIT